MDLCWKKGVRHIRIIITQDWAMQTEGKRAWTKLLSPERDWCVLASGVLRVAASMTWSLPWWVTLAWSFHLCQPHFLKLKYSWFTMLCSFLVYRKWFSYTHTHTHTHIYRYMYIYFHILFPYGPLQSIEYSSLCYTIGLCWLCILYMKVNVAQSCPTLCDPVDCSPPGSSVLGILQPRILEWVAIPFSRGPSRPQDRTGICFIAGRFLQLSYQGSPFIYIYISILCI